MKNVWGHHCNEEVTLGPSVAYLTKDFHCTVMRHTGKAKVHYIMKLLNNLNILKISVANSKVALIRKLCDENIVVFDNMNIILCSYMNTILC